MATDSTHLQPGNTGIEADTDMAAGDQELGSIQLAAAVGDAPVPVNIPRGQQIIVVPVRPGQTIELPTDSPDGLLAKLGADGNLAIVVDGRTIILQGYAAANEGAPVTIVTNDGDVVDIVDVVAGTMPDLDIQTAAGPAAAGAQAGAAAATGGGIFVPFGVGPLLGGIGAEGVLGATQLQYKLIDDERVEFVKDEEEPDGTPGGVEISPVVLDEDGLPGGNAGGPDDEPDPATKTATGNVIADFGPDGPRAIDPYLMTNVVNGSQSGLFALSGGADPTQPGAPILLFLDPPAGGFQVLHGLVGLTEYFRITLNTTTGAFEVEQIRPLFHPDENNTEDNVSLNVDFVGFDANSDPTSTGTLNASFDDDSPEVTAGEGEFKLAVDETTFGSKLDFDDPNFPNDGILDGARTENDDLLVLLPQALKDIGTVIGASVADGSVLFNISLGADGGAAADAEEYSLTILAAATGLIDTETQQPITLHDNAGVIEGRNNDGDVVFAFTVDPVSGEVSMAQYRAIDHGDEEADPGAVDEVLFLGSGKLAVTLTATDGDGDRDSESVDIGNSISFEDDGPNASVSTLPVPTAVLDETRPEGTEEDGDSDPAGLKSVVVDFSLNFGLADFGSDGPGDVVYALKLTGTDVGSGLYALDASDTQDVGEDGDGIGQGAEILLNQSGDVITGSVGGTDYFTITLDPDTGKVTFEQLANIWHGDTGSDDDTETLTLDQANLLQLVQTVVDADGDEDTAAIDLGAGVFQIEDDGPNATLADRATPTAILDETRPVGSEEDGDSDPAGLDKVTVDFSGNFGTPDFGSDGPGDAVYSLKLKGTDVGSGLYALDASDIQDVGEDGDGIGQGAEILLNQSGDVITGSVGGTDYFTITLDPDTGKVTFEQLSNIWHGDTGSDDDTETLTLSETNLLQLVQTVIDADGDSEEAALDLSRGVFQIEDDGPSATVVDETAAPLVLDETRPVGTEEDGDNDPAGLDKVTVDLSVNFGAADFGSDGPGDVSYALKLTGANVGSGLYALDASDIQDVGEDGDGIGQGAEIVLNQSGDVITGSVGGTDYFTITLDPDTGKVTFEQLANIWHGDTGSDDDSETLTLDQANLLQLVQTVTDADGDEDTAAIDLGAGVFTIQDDGPSMEDVPNIVMANQVKTVTGQIDFDAGSDGVGTFIISSVDDGGLATTIDGLGTNQATGLDSNGDPIYVLTVDEDGQYHFELIQTSLEGLVEFDLTGVDAGGPVPSITFTDPIDPSAQIVFENAKQDGNPANFNPSNGEFGVGSNLFNKNESWTTTFLGFLASTFTLAYDFNGSGVLTVNYTAYDSSGDAVVGSFGVSASGETTVDFLAAGNFDGLVTHIDFSITSNENNQSAKIKLTEFSAETVTPPEDQHISFDVALQDGDGDTTAAQTFTVDVLATDSNAGTPAFDIIGTAEDDLLAGFTSKVDNFDLTGGGHDIVQFTSELDGNDVITGFNNGSIAAEQDYIDLDPLFDSLAVASGARAALVDVSVSGPDTIVKLDVDGVAGFDDAGDIHIAIKGVTSGITVGTDPSDDIQLGIS